MKRVVVLLALFGMIFGSVAVAQKPVEKTVTSAPPAGGDLADGLVQRLSHELHVKTVAGEPVKVGSVTLIPILMVDVNFAGGTLPKPPKGGTEIGGFLMNGEARPLGFVAITSKGTRFISTGKTQAK